MADNLNVPTAGVPVATDEIGGVHYPWTKLAFGGDDELYKVGEGNRIPVKDAPSTGTGRLASASAGVNASIVKNGAGTLRQVSGYNASASARYLRLYNKATAPTVASDTARKVLYLPPQTAFVFDLNDYYVTGIAYAITTGPADLDTGTLTAGDILALNVDYL